MEIRCGRDVVVEGVGRPGLEGRPEERSSVVKESVDPRVAAADVLGDCVLVVDAAAKRSASISAELRVIASIPSPVTMTLCPDWLAGPVPPAAAIGGRVGVEGPVLEPKLPGELVDNEYECFKCCFCSILAAMLTKLGKYS